MKIYYDTREQKPFLFRTFAHITPELKTLKTGDYTIENYEDKITVDRKHSTAELALNIGSGWKRFSKELVRMQDFDYACILCSFPESYVNMFPKNSGIPRGRWWKLVVSPKLIRKRIHDIKDMGVDVIFCRNRIAAEAKLVRIFEEYVKLK